MKKRYCSISCWAEVLSAIPQVWPKTRPGPLALNATRPGLKRGPAAHTVLRNRNAPSHATSKRRRPVLLWREADHCPHANLTVAHLSPSSSLLLLAMNSVMALILCYITKFAIYKMCSGQSDCFGRLLVCAGRPSQEMPAKAVLP